MHSSQLLVGPTEMVCESEAFWWMCQQYLKKYILLRWWWRGCNRGACFIWSTFALLFRFSRVCSVAKNVAPHDFDQDFGTVTQDVDDDEPEEIEQPKEHLKDFHGWSHGRLTLESFNVSLQIGRRHGLHSLGNAFLQVLERRFQGLNDAPV